MINGNVHLLLRFIPEADLRETRVSHLARLIRELAEHELSDIETRYGFVVDVIEPRNVL